MNIRVLEGHEFPKLESLFADNGVALPNPDFSEIIVAEDQNEIVGFLVAQLVLHTEPVWIKPEHRGKGLWRDLHLMAQKSIGDQEYFAFAPDDRISHMAESVGLKKMPWSVFKREINPCHS